MFVFKSLVAFLTFTLVVAIPHGSHSDVFNHRVRAVKARTCKPDQAKNGTAVVPTVPATATPSPASAQNLHAEPSSSSKHSSSSSNSVKTHSSSSSTSAHPTATKSSTSVVGGALAALAPLGYSQSTGWSTSPSSPDPLPLSDATFKPRNLLQGLPWSYSHRPDGQPAIQVNYPKGSYNFQHEPRGGISWYSSGPGNVDISKAKELVLGYVVYLKEGFNPVKGGKLPGLYGGNDGAGAVSCSGGSRNDACFSVRLMWRGGAAGEAYTYLPPSFKANDRVCDIAPFSDCNPTYGASVGRGAFDFAIGAPTAVSMRVRLNDVGQQNGEFEIFANGKSVISADGLVLRNSKAATFGGLMTQSFFGGSSPDFAAVKDETMWLSDFTMQISEYL
ncbi:hypothetical protein BDW22DRAFT_1343311 [Trametopsis cervina]|nr:hypothetical protein BDW22DRAFT_1343311 [Trametopsis cervina]